jgi:hypothetical protein
MGGEHSPDTQSSVRISRKCPHGVYQVGDPREANQACSICRSEAGKKTVSEKELRDLKKENDIWK